MDYNFEEYKPPDHYETRGRKSSYGDIKRSTTDYILNIRVQVKAQTEEEAKKKVLRLARKNYVYILSHEHSAT